jgi:hypothetical protein
VPVLKVAALAGAAATRPAKKVAVAATIAATLNDLVFIEIDPLSMRCSFRLPVNRCHWLVVTKMFG